MVRIFLLIAIVIYPAFAILDIWSMPETKEIAWWIRFAVVTPSILTTYLLTYTKFYRNYHQHILTALTIIAALGISFMIAVSKEYELAYTNYYPGLFIVIFSVVTLIRLRFIYALFATLFITIINEAFMIFVQHMYEGGFTGWKFLLFINNNFYFIMLNGAAIAAAYIMELFQRKDFIKRRMIDEEIRVIEEKNRQITKQRNRLDNTLKDLKRIQARLEAIVHNEVAGISIINKDFKYLFTNKTWSKMLGYDEHQIYRLKKLDITHPEDIGITRQFFSDIFSGNLKKYTLEKRYIRKDGSIFWGELYVSPLFDTEGRVEAIVSIVVDSTQRKIAEDKLLRSERRLRSILNEKEKYLNILNNELKQATQYVLSIIPDPIEEGVIKTHWKLVPSSKLGGDALGYHWLDDENFAFYVIDACGHGVGPALHSVSIINVLRNASLPDTDFTDPEKVLFSLNKAFPMEEHNSMYITIWYGVFNTKSRVLSYSSGGHPGALYLNSKNEKITLQTRNFIVGATENYHYRSASVTIEPASNIYVFSDGCYELIKDNDSKIWGVENLYEYLTVNNNGDAKELNQLYTMALEYSKDKKLEDDFTILKLVIE